MGSSRRLSNLAGRRGASASAALHASHSTDTHTHTQSLLTTRRPAASFLTSLVIHSNLNNERILVIQAVGLLRLLYDCSGRPPPGRHAVFLALFPSETHPHLS